MKSGSVWEPVCSLCGKKSAYFEAWQDEAPGDTPPHDGGCCSAAYADQSKRVAVWERCEVPAYGPNFGGLIDPMPRPIPDHFNTSLGKRVHSREHLEHLQKVHGCEDAVVKGDAAERLVPRDLERKVKEQKKKEEALAGAWK